MKYFHELKEIKLDLKDAISRHSADKTIAYKEVSGEPVYLGYYLPKNYQQGKKYSVFIFVHGGGWSNHKVFDEQPYWQGDHLGFLARYYAEKGFLCVSVDYRLIRENGQAVGYEIIDCYEDCCDAVDYIINHAKEYGADIQNMYLLGESAGGHLAGALVTFDYDRKYQFKKAILVNPITHLEDKWQNWMATNSRHSKLSELRLQEQIQFLSPLYHVSSRTCETILIHGESDTVVAPEHSKKFYEKMKAVSRLCELHIIEKTNHAFLLAEYKNQDLTACKIAIDIIDRNILERE